MRVLVHDHSGHPFQVQLSRELARRGHVVTHSYCAAYVSGKGHLVAGQENLDFDPIGADTVAEKSRFARRLLQELRWGVDLIRQVRRTRPDVVLVSQRPDPHLIVFSIAMAVLRVPWVLWHQDVYAVAVRSFAGAKLSRAFRLVAHAFEIGERCICRRAAGIVAIAPSFIPVHEAWGTADKTVVIPNWAPLDEIVPVDRKNDWAVENQLDDTLTLLYSGTLGLKHDPALLVALAREVRDQGKDVQLVVVNEGPAVEVLRAEADAPRRTSHAPAVPALRPAARGARQRRHPAGPPRPAGRRLLGAVEDAVLPVRRPTDPRDAAVGEPRCRADRPGRRLRGAPRTRKRCPRPPSGPSRCSDDVERRQELGEAARELAEHEFALSECADRFETLLTGCVR